MVATVHLLTNEPTKQLSFANMRLAGNNDYLVAGLRIHSRGFSCDHQFYFDRFHADRTIELLEAMDRGAVGEAVLKQEWEDDHVCFRTDAIGHVIVTGEMVEHSSGHRLAFSIETDQTVIKPFIRDFREALAAAR